MAVLAISALGAAVGGTLITGTVLGLSGAAIGWTVGSLLGSALFPQKAQGPRLGDLRVSGTEYGQPIPYIECSPRISGQIIWASPKRETANTQSAGKGGGPEVTTYTYDVDLVILLSENPIGDVARIWSNGDLVYNGVVTRSSIWGGLTIYSGSDDQLPDPVYEAGVGAGNAPALRGRGYVVIQGLQLGTSGQLPNLTFEIAGVDYTGAIIRLPLDAANQANDVIPPSSLISTGIGTITDDGYNMPPGSSSYGGLVSLRAQDGGKFNPIFDGNAKNYLTFDFKLNSIVGTSFTYQTFVGVYRFSNANFRLRVNSLEQVEFRVDNFPLVGAPTVPTQTYAPFPDKGNLTFTWNTGEESIIRVYLNGTLIFTVTNVSPPFTAARLLIECVLGNLTPSPGRYVNGWTIKNLVYGAGDPPTLTRYTRTVNESVQRLLQRAGFPATDYDVTGINGYTKRVRALAVGQIGTTRSLIEQYQGAFFFEVAKSDKVYFRQRPTTPVATIPYADLRVTNDSASDEEPLALVKANNLEIPAQASITYPNVASDYTNGTEYSFRLNAIQESVEAVSTALGMVPDEAKGVVDALLLDRVAGQVRANIKVGLKYAYLEPADIINVINFDGRTYRMRIGTKKDNLTSIEFELVLDDVGAINLSAITSNDYVLVDDVKQVAPTFFEVLDIPLLRDVDDAPGYYVAIAPDYTDGSELWDGAVFLRKWAVGEFENLYISSDAAVLGTCLTVLGNWTGGPEFDESNSVTVRVSGNLASVTRADILNSIETNLALVGNEIIQFRLATFVQTTNGENEYKLTGLLRGQRGTEANRTSHASNERFVLLNTRLRNVPNTVSQLNADSEVKAVTLNLPLSSVTEEPFVDTGVRLKPFSVAQLRVLADGADMVLTWDRRTRWAYNYGGTIGVYVPLAEATELYRVRVYDGATLVRTIDATSPTYTYMATDIAADGFASADTITFQVTQVSAIVGDGFPAQVQGIAP